MTQECLVSGLFAVRNPCLACDSQDMDTCYHWSQHGSRLPLITTWIKVTIGDSMGQGYHWLQHGSRRHRGMDRSLTDSEDMLRTMDGAFFCGSKRGKREGKRFIS